MTSLDNSPEGGRDPLGQDLAVPVEPASGLAPLGFDPSRILQLVPKDMVPCWPWDLRHMESHPFHPVGEACSECGMDVALPRDLKGRIAVCVYCALDEGYLPCVEITPEDDRQLAAIATEARRAEPLFGVSAHEGADPKGIAQRRSAMTRDGLKATRLCRGCRLYDLPAVLSANGRVLSNRVARCLWEHPPFDLPASIAWDAKTKIRTRFMEPNEGADCLCWEPRL